MPRAGEHFHIAGDLLAGPGGDGRWNNLGYWNGAPSYTAAARTLAHRHGQAAGLRPGMRVLELACGYGAALDLWAAEFGVTASHALELRQACVTAITAPPQRPMTRILQGRFDEPIAALVGDTRFDAILCVDAAYHARSLPAFLAACAPVLAPQGVLVFSTLVRGPGYTTLHPLRRVILHRALALADIPRDSVRTPQGLIRELGAAGLDSERLDDLTEPVLAGFAGWVPQRQPLLDGAARWSPDWLKIRMTAALCRSVMRNRSLAYVLAVGRRISP
jgi:SAM-dependent methyltransferase